MIKLLFLLVLTAFTGPNIFGHGGEDHSKDKKVATPRKDEINKFKVIGLNYKKKVEPIFKKACFDCHSNKTVYPWYYNLPLVDTYIDSDIAEAKSHLDFSNGFPFISHDSPTNDLSSIFKSILDKKMPPKNYLWLHSDAKLTIEDVKEVKEWVKDSLRLLNEK